MRYHPRTRLVFLGVVNAIILVHIVAYYVFDRTGIGCVDFFGLATFAGKGQITAGTIFLGALIVITLCLGRVFCGWGCHFALFQDLLSRFLDRIGVRVPFRRSRLELIVPPLLLFVTLAYPILAWWRHAGLPSSASVDLSYPEVWHLLPGFKGIALILLFDVVALTLLFGGRAFCRYICPYGLFLKPFHALSPMRITKVGNCSGCGSCAKACPMGVPIKYEVETLGVVHDLNCMNCGDCVPACPVGALALHPTRRAYAFSFKRIVTRPTSPLWIEATLLGAAIAGLFLFRGREFGDFLSVGMGLVAGAAVIVAIRPQYVFRARRATARPSMSALRVTFALVAAFFTFGLAGQAISSYVTNRVERALQDRNYADVERSYAIAIPIIQGLRPVTFYLDDFFDRRHAIAEKILSDADSLLVRESWVDAAWLYRSVILLDPNRLAVHGNLGTALLKQGLYWEAAGCYLRVLEGDPNDLIALYHLAMTYIQLKQDSEAVALVLRILDIDTVGNAHLLIRENPLFQLLEKYPEYRRSMAAYALARSPSAVNVTNGGKP